MPDTAVLRDRIIAEARARFGIPYALPPNPPSTTDCSHYVRDVFEAAGLPFSTGVRVAEQERQDTIPIDWDDVLPGDLLFFEGTYEAPGPPGPDGKIASHIGISLGAGSLRMYDANDGRGTSGETNIDTNYWQGHLLEARRHPALVGAAVPAPGQLRRGIDVASYQGNPDWAAVSASGIAFAFTKATEGTDYLNPTFARNWSELRRVGIARGAYHYARPEYGNAARSEADYFLTNVLRMGELAAGDMVVLDLEPPSRVQDLAGWAIVWLDRVAEKTGIRPIVYTGRWVIDQQGLASASALGEFPLWLAAYQEQMPAAPAPWQRVAFWQHTDKGRVPGIVGNVDMNLFNGPAEHLALYGKGASVIQPAPADPRDAQIAALQERVGGLEIAVAHLADILAGDRLQGIQEEARAIREQFLGKRPAA